MTMLLTGTSVPVIVHTSQRTQIMFSNQYEEHLAHSMDDGSQWDGFDRGDTDQTSDSGREVTGRMRGKHGPVKIIENWHSDFGSVFEVWVNDRLIVESFDRHDAIETARSWL